jgi:uncharacterized protein with PQ loop repeat
MTPLRSRACAVIASPVASSRYSSAVIPPDSAAINKPQNSPPATGLEKILRALSVITMLMTVPQVLAIWIGRNAAGVSLISWLAYLVSAALWFIYGLQKRDKTIYLACIGWIVLDAAIVAGVIVHR